MSLDFVSPLAVKDFRPGAQCESQLARNALSFAALTGYRRALDLAWASELGALTFLANSIFDVAEDRLDMAQKSL